MNDPIPVSLVLIWGAKFLGSVLLAGIIMALIERHDDRRGRRV